MTAVLASLWRHPIKALGREEIENADLTTGQTLPGDRVWAIAHERSKAEPGEWARCINFLRAASSPALMAVTAQLLADGQVALSHPQRPDICLHPERDATQLIAWVRPLVAKGRPAPAAVLPAPRTRGFTDTSAPTVSLGNLASHRAVEQTIGRDLAIHRWRCNLWVAGFQPWAERDWIGRTLRIGGAELHVENGIERCMATTANPDTGEQDADTLGALSQFGHSDFTVAARVTKPGHIARQCEVQIL
ncbi:MOSC domain-containing protein [Rhodobacteraceae bacterium F11138]|nr:MOSC domain-containing protein [Rhodobacteraceae bacterium F11138]